MPSFLWALTGWKATSTQLPIAASWYPQSETIVHWNIVGFQEILVKVVAKSRRLPIALPVDAWAGSWLWNRCQFPGWPCSSTARRSRSTGGTGSGAEDAAYKSGFGGHSILNGDFCHGAYFDVLDRFRPGMCCWKKEIGKVYLGESEVLISLFSA